ncbi:unnamed protein product [Effrenium voratum]|uniref:Uncharacterized protein n=1 Tax=Effrenium voratum TaxID=2562239 RepID=A0AA36JJE8_9DINO|nr:unnamed protein product [Effrenium voratum]CAJ1415605.1 unnamed protein product [Effrenium voratum]
MRPAARGLLKGPIPLTFLIARSSCHACAQAWRSGMAARSSRLLVCLVGLCLLALPSTFLAPRTQARAPVVGALGTVSALAPQAANARIEFEPWKPDFDWEAWGNAPEANEIVFPGVIIVSIIVLYFLLELIETLLGGEE